MRPFCAPVQIFLEPRVGSLHRNRTRPPTDHTKRKAGPNRKQDARATPSSWPWVFSYSYSHATDAQGTLGLFYNGNQPRNLRQAFGSSDFGHTHVFNLSIVYQLPKFTPDFAGVTRVWGRKVQTALCPRPTRISPADYVNQGRTFRSQVSVAIKTSRSNSCFCVVNFLPWAVR